MRRAFVGCSTVVAFVLAFTSSAWAQRGSERQPRGRVVSGASGASIVGRIGYGGAIDRPAVNPFNLGLGIEFAYAARYVPVAIGVEVDGYIGAGGPYAGVRRYDNVFHTLAWFGYDRAINSRFVVRPAMAVGVEVWRLHVGTDWALSPGALVAFEGRGLIFLRERLYFDALLRVTGSVHRTVNIASVTSRGGIPGLLLYAGVGYTFGRPRTRRH